MNSTIRTVIYIVIAAALGVVAWFTRPSPPQLEYFSDQGELFYPGFTDPLEAASLEVIAYDEESGTARPFKVQVKDGLWSIPSHYDYPADGEEQLAKTAASMIDLRRDAVQSDRAQDHEALGVIDPLDDSTVTFRGRGTRIVLRDEGGAVLADYIISKPLEGQEGFRYVRLPDKKRTYKVNIGDVELSTRFADWIETDLLAVSSSEIQRIVIDDHSVDEQTGTVQRNETLLLEKGDDNQWTLTQLPPDRELDRSKVNQMTSALSQLTITGVRPKPASLTADLRTQEDMQLDLGTQLSLQSKGYFISRSGELFSNEGEVRIGTRDGILYKLRFGEVLFGEGLEVSAGLGEDQQAEEAPEGPTQEGSENRYLFVTAELDESLLPPRPQRPAPPAELEEDAPERGVEEAQEETEQAEASGGGGEDVEPPGAELEEAVAVEDAGEAGAAEEEAFEAARAAYEQELEEWEAQLEAARQRVAELNERFAPWYYVISATDFHKIRLNREQLTKEPAPAAG